MRERVVLVCPGRGTYGREELGYLGRYHAHKHGFLADLDAYRSAQGRIPVSELDGQTLYSLAMHGSSENASLLIYACALADAADIDLERYDVVAVTGNSLGWYLALAAGEALAPDDAARLVDTMGALMERHGVGGQVLYPLVDQDWRPSPIREAALRAALFHAARRTGETVHVSIRLGGYVVLAGSDAALDIVMTDLPPADGRFPLRLARHAAFHTPLLAHVAEAAREVLPPSLFRAPSVPLVDGRGVIWRRQAPDLQALREYTLGAQITGTYDFTKAIEVAVKEFAPDRVILTGPGNALGAPVGQILVRLGWRGLRSREDFVERQARDPVVLSMGLETQRRQVLAPVPFTPT